MKNLSYGKICSSLFCVAEILKTENFFQSNSYISFFLLYYYSINSAILMKQWLILPWYHLESFSQIFPQYLSRKCSKKMNYWMNLQFFFKLCMSSLLHWDERHLNGEVRAELRTILRFIATHDCKWRLVQNIVAKLFFEFFQEFFPGLGIFVNTLGVLSRNAESGKAMQSFGW